MKKKLNMEVYWWRGKVYNFGDEITPWLVKKMYSKNIDKPCSIKNAKLPILLAVGSIMRLSSNKTVVWGSGIRNIDQCDFSSSKKYCAVRGPFTRRRLLQLGYKCSPVYGDPGLLLPNHYNPSVSKEYKIGLIPHLVDYEEINKIYSKNKDILVIDLKTNNIERVVRQILLCERTLSTSLHGVITSVAYNVPTKWMKFSNEITGDDIKFYDFFASLDCNILKEFDYKKIKHKKDSIYNPLLFSKKCLSTNFLERQTHLYSKKDLNLKKLIDACPLKLI